MEILVRFVKSLFVFLFFVLFPVILMKSFFSGMVISMTEQVWSHHIFFMMKILK